MKHGTYVVNYEDDNKVTITLYADDGKEYVFDVRMNIIHEIKK